MSPQGLARFCLIQDENDATTIPFELWDWQHDLLDWMHGGKYRVILKARQLGVSWLVCLDALWTALFQPGANVLMLSQGKDEAAKLLEHVKFLYLNLPNFLKPELLKDNASIFRLGFDRDPITGKHKLESTIRALPATENAGRSQTATLVIMDEAAFHPYAAQNFAAIQPTVAKGSARLVSLSTANGTGNWFAVTYKGAKKGENPFAATFLPYSYRPGRDEEWYKTTKSSYTSEPLKFFQEFPKDDTEAFIASGGAVLNLELLREMEDGPNKTLMEPLSVDAPMMPHTLSLLVRDHGVKVFKPPVFSHAYVAGLDPSSSHHGRDQTSFRIMDVQTGEDVASWTGKTDDPVVALIVQEMGRAYRWPYLGVERNGVGMALLGELVNHSEYPLDCLYHHTDNTKRRDQQYEQQATAPGFPATAQSKALFISEAKTALANRTTPVRDAELLEEMKTFVEDPETHKVEAKAPDRDDRVSAWLTCVHLRLQPEAEIRWSNPAPAPPPVSLLRKRQRVGA